MVLSLSESAAIVTVSLKIKVWRAGEPGLKQINIHCLHLTMKLLRKSVINSINIFNFTRVLPVIACREING